ncbi:MAG: MFS transporter [Deltaproteobacteria bacterium]|nr:MFS transporter [Deltaproteobacteria bacterium]
MSSALSTSPPPSRVAVVDPVRPATATPLWRALAPICLVVFAEFLAMGLPLPVLPTHVHDTLGFGAFVVGLVIGAQSWVTLFTRHLAGVRSDARGPAHAVVPGLVISALAAALYALSSIVPEPSASLALLVVGRGLLGLGESLVITGALAWGVALAGRARAGVVMAWVGIAMYGAMSIGAVLGASIAHHFGFVAMSIAAALAPLAGLVAARLARPVAATGGARLPFRHVARRIALPGAGLALAALGFGAIASFAVLHFEARGWSGAALATAAFGAAYVLARLAFGALPDRLGGARVALASAAVTALGQVGLWLAPSPALAIAAAGLTGLGFSLVFPSFGVEAVRRVPPESRGVALGAYAASFDLALGVGVPLLGLASGALDTGAAFALAALGALASLVIALRLGAARAEVTR